MTVQIKYKYILTSLEHKFELEAWLNPYVGLGNFDYLKKGQSYAFTASYGKSYFNLVNGKEMDLKSGESCSWSGGYVFHVKQK